MNDTMPKISYGLDALIVMNMVPLSVAPVVNLVRPDGMAGGLRRLAAVGIGGGDRRVLTACTVGALDDEGMSRLLADNGGDKTE